MSKKLTMLWFLANILLLMFTSGHAKTRSCERDTCLERGFLDDLRDLPKLEQKYTMSRHEEDAENSYRIGNGEIRENRERDNRESRRYNSEAKRNLFEASDQHDTQDSRVVILRAQQTADRRMDRDFRSVQSDNRESREVRMQSRYNTFETPRESIEDRGMNRDLRSYNNEASPRVIVINRDNLDSRRENQVRQETFAARREDKEIRVANRQDDLDTLRDNRDLRYVSMESQRTESVRDINNVRRENDELRRENLESQRRIIDARREIIHSRLNTIETMRYNLESQRTIDEIQRDNNELRQNNLETHDRRDVFEYQRNKVPEESREQRDNQQHRRDMSEVQRENQATPRHIREQRQDNREREESRVDIQQTQRASRELRQDNQELRRQDHEARRNYRETGVNRDSSFISNGYETERCENNIRSFRSLDESLSRARQADNLQEAERRTYNDEERIEYRGEYEGRLNERKNPDDQERANRLNLDTSANNERRESMNKQSRRANREEREEAIDERREQQSERLDTARLMQQQTNIWKLSQFKSSVDITRKLFIFLQSALIAIVLLKTIGADFNMQKLLPTISETLNIACF